MYIIVMSTPDSGGAGGGGSGSGGSSGSGGRGSRSRWWHRHRSSNDRTQLEDTETHEVDCDYEPDKCVRSLTIEDSSKSRSKNWKVPTLILLIILLIAVRIAISCY